MEEYKFLLDIAIILAMTKSFSLVSKKFNMPPVVGALIAGIILGPVVLNVVSPSDSVLNLAEVGVVVLMFQAGLETDIDELISKAAAYEDVCEENGEPASLSGFLEEVALVADIDSLDEDQDYVILMTLHSAKGLEFPQVYLAGMEDGLFPSYMSIVADDAAAELEEERRLAYVGITRAKQNLAITCAKQRMVRGETQYNKVSRLSLIHI